MMHALSATARYPTRLPADEQRSGVNAGVSFALNRHFTPFEVGNERMLLSESLSEVVDGMDAVREGEGSPALQKARESLDFVCRTLSKLPSDQ